MMADIQYFKKYFMSYPRKMGTLIFFPLVNYQVCAKWFLPCRTMTCPLLCKTKYDLLSASKFVQSLL